MGYPKTASPLVICKAMRTLAKEPPEAVIARLAICENRCYLFIDFH
jgi:hypothetical protein